MEQVISSVLKNNDRAAAARYMEKSSREKAKGAGAWDDPMLMLGALNLPTSSYKFGQDDMTMKMIGLSWSIPYAGEKGLQSKAGTAEAAASGADRQATELDLITAAKLAYYDLYYKNKILADLGTQRELMAEIVDATSARLQTNQANQDEVLSAQAGLWRLDSDILTARQAVDEALFNLNALMGNKADSPQPPPAEPTFEKLPAATDPWIDAAYTNYPELQKLKFQSESFGLSAAASRRMRWPMLSLSTEYGYRQGIGMMGPRDNMVSLSANISLPIFSARKEGAMARSMDLMRQGSEAEAVQMRRDIVAKITALHERASYLSQSIDLYRDKIIPTTQEAYQSAFSSYVNNRTNFTNLLDDALALYRDRIAYSQLSLQFAGIMAEVERYISGRDAYGANITSENKLNEE